MSNLVTVVTTILVVAHTVVSYRHPSPRSAFVTSIGGFTLSSMVEQSISSWPPPKSSALYAKKKPGSSSMPSAEELAALDKVLDGEIEWGELDDWADSASSKEWMDEVPVGALNKPPPKKGAKREPSDASGNGAVGSTPASTSAAASNPKIPKRATPLKKPNSDWRNSASRNPFPQESPEDEYIVDFDPPAPKQERNWNNPGAGGNGVDSMYDAGNQDLEDLGYGDFERAFAELEMGGLNPRGGGAKRSAIVEEHEGLMAGSVIKGGVWGNLIQPDGQPTRFSRIHKDSVDLVLLYACPRRSNDEFRTVLNEFSKLPLTKMRMAAVAVSTDSSNDHRKMLKRGGGNPPYSVLSDSTGILMEALKCKQPGRSMSALLILALNKPQPVDPWKEGDAKRIAKDVDATIIRVLYQGGWDAYTTKDVVQEEVEEYRKNPAAYMQRQVGLS